MDLELVESHPRRVLEAFRRGQFDGLEVLGQADEKAFFELCFGEQLLDGLATAMPTARKKEEVPRWFVLAANLSLKLHGEHAFAALERVVRCGGLLSALDPAIASKHLDPQSREVVLGFDEHNHPVNYEELSPAQRLPWQEWIVPAPAPAPSVKRPAVIERRERQRQKTLVQRQAQAPPPGPATVITARELCPIKGFQWAEARVP